MLLLLKSNFDFYEIILAVLTFLLPPVPLFVIKNKILGFIFGSVVCWILLVASAEYNLATDIEYNSIAPAISLLFGWVIGAIYCSFWLVIVLVWQNYKNRSKK